jgi:thymidylate kinase
MLIVFEGLDKSGKTTQCKILHERLLKLNIKSKILSFPKRHGHIGSLIDKYLKKEINLTDEAIHLLFSADRWESKPEMLQLMKEGIHLIVDRYTYSGSAYSTAKGLPMEWCLRCDKGLPIPDLVIFLNNSYNREGEERYETLEFQKKVSEQYEIIREPNWLIINNDYDKILTSVLELLK